VLYAVLPVPHYHQALGLEPFHIGLLLSVNRWIRLITNHVAERASNRYNRAGLLVAALCLGSCLALIYGTVRLFPILLLARVCWGLCWSFIRQIGMMTVVDSVPQTNIAQGIGIYNGISRIGGALGLFFGAWLCDRIGFSPTMITFCLVSLTAVVPGAISQRTQQHGGRSVRPSGQPSGGRDPALWFSGFIARCVGTIILSTLGLALQQRFGTATAIGGMIVGVATLNGVFVSGRWLIDSLVAPLLGALADRIGYWRTAWIFFAVGAFVLLQGALASSTIVWVVSVLAHFVCGTALLVTLSAVAGRKGSRAIASYVTSVDVGSATGPLLGWTILQFLTDSTIMFGIGSALFALAALTTYVVSQRREANRESEPQASAKDQRP
jgi:predicted MFS family arabinose efflux permease